MSPYFYSLGMLLLADEDPPGEWWFPKLENEENQ